MTSLAAFLLERIDRVRHGVTLTAHRITPPGEGGTRRTGTPAQTSTLSQHEGHVRHLARMDHHEGSNTHE